MRFTPANRNFPIGTPSIRPLPGAFTLIELLVTIGIIAVLAALLLGGLSMAKTRAGAIQCLSQLKQLGIAMTVYGTDNNELLPAAHSVVPWNGTNPVAWMRAVFPAPAEPAFLTCPSYSRLYNQSPYSYFIGSRAAFVEAGAQPAPLPLRQIHLPTEYILSGDCNFPFEAIDADPDDYTADTLFGMAPIGHGRQVNILFGDMHAIRAKRFDPSSMTFSFSDAGKAWGE